MELRDERDEFGSGDDSDSFDAGESMAGEYIWRREMQFERLTGEIPMAFLSLFRSDVTDMRKALLWAKIQSDFAARAANAFDDDSALLAFDRLHVLRSEFCVLERNHFDLTSGNVLFVENKILMMLLKMMMYIFWFLFCVCLSLCVV